MTNGDKSSASAAPKGYTLSGRPRVRASSKFPEDHVYITIREAAAYLHMCVQTFRKMVPDSFTPIPYGATGRYSVFLRAQVYEYRKKLIAHAEMKSKAAQPKMDSAVVRREQGRR